jgi:hypothetical protein
MNLSLQQYKVGKTHAPKYSPTVTYTEQKEPSYVQPHQPVFKTSSQPQQIRYDYEEETTQRTNQYVQQQQIQQSKPSRFYAPQSASRQHHYDVGIVYSQEPRHMKSVNQQQKYQQYLDRSPPVFPTSEQVSSSPSNNNERAQQNSPLSLFNPAPASPRYDILRPKVRRKSRKLHKSRNKRKLRNRSFVIIFKKRRYYRD